MIDEQLIPQTIVDTLAQFKIDVTIEKVVKGATISRYLFKVNSLKTRLSDIKRCADDISAAIEAYDVVVCPPAPDTALFGIEVPNKTRRPVELFKLMNTTEFINAKGELNFVIGEDVFGKTIIADLAKLPHILVAGTTGSGKTVCLNNLIVSLMCKYSPEHVRFVMVDPRLVELSRFNGIPHLLNESKAIVEIKDTLASMDGLIAEMESRYSLFSASNVSNISDYNRLCDKNKLSKIPYIVFVVDELAEIMAVNKKEFEVKLIRLAQKARAAGIHIVLSTQRPSTDTVTGTLKGNLPCRMVFKVSSTYDSQTVLGSGGAEKLMGMGDMLYMDPLDTELKRIQCAYVSSDEINTAIKFALNTDGETYRHVEPKAFLGAFLRSKAELSNPVVKTDDSLYPLYKKSLRFWLEKNNGKASISSLQRGLYIGFNRAGRILENLQEMGYVESPDENVCRPLRVLVTLEELDDLFPDED